MNIMEIPGANINLAETQDEYLTLPARVGKITVACDDGEVAEVPAFQSAWVPTPEELEALNNGEHIVLCVLGASHPPVMLNVSGVDYNAE